MMAVDNDRDFVHCLKEKIMMSQNHFGCLHSSACDVVLVFHFHGCLGSWFRSCVSNDFPRLFGMNCDTKLIFLLIL